MKSSAEKATAKDVRYIHPVSLFIVFAMLFINHSDCQYVHGQVRVLFSSVSRPLDMLAQENFKASDFNQTACHIQSPRFQC